MLKMKKLSKISLLICLCLASFSSFADAGRQVAGTITFMIGDVFVSHDKTAWVNANLDMKIHQGDQIRTEAESRCEITLEDGTIVRMDENTLYSQFLLIRERLNEDKKSIQSNVVIVGIDDRTLNRLGAYNPSKYRRYHIDLLANILKGKPAAVAYDILFGDPHDDPDVDRRFSEIIKKGWCFRLFSGLLIINQSKCSNRLPTTSITNRT